MHESVVDAVVPGILGQGLQKARRARGLTQQEVADSLELARTTVTALEKGERRIRPDELISLAGLYGRQVSTFVGSRVSPNQRPPRSARVARPLKLPYFRRHVFTASGKVIMGLV